jgi:GntR family transcriptional regulator
MSSRTPAYKKVYSQMMEMITNETYPIGSLVPREPDLCELFSVSRTTLRKAMELLAHEGFVDIKQGRGTEVLDFKATQKLNHVTSFSETLEAKGFIVESKSTHIDKIVPPASVLEELTLAPGTEVVRIQRIQIANGKPIAIITNYIVADLVPDITMDAGKFVSLYHHLESKYGIKITSARDNIKAKVSDFLESELLQISIGSALLVDRRITFSGNKPIENVIMIVDAAKYEFAVNLVGRPG